MGSFLYFIGALVFLSFASRNIKMAMAGNSRIESWIGAAVCLSISLGLLFAGCSNSSSVNTDNHSNYNYDNSNPHYPWESELEQYREEKKPWE